MGDWLEKGTDRKGIGPLALPLMAYSQKVLEETGGEGVLGVRARKNINKLTQKQRNAEVLAGLEKAGYVRLSKELVQKAQLDELREAWGFKTRQEVIRASLAFLIQHTRAGLQRLDVGSDMMRAHK